MTSGWQNGNMRQLWRARLEGTVANRCPTNTSNMKTSISTQLHIAKVSGAILASTFVLALTFGLSPARADETCSSPYLARIEGQEEFVYVWTLGVEGLGDGADKLVTVDVKPGSPNYGKVVNASSVGGRNEAHHGGFTDDRRQLWLAGLESSRVFIFDVHTDPAKPRHAKTIDNFAEATGGAMGPHGASALPGRVLIPCLSNAKDHGGRTALVEYSNDGNYIATHWMPTKDEPRGAADAKFADGYGYDARVLPRKNALLTSSFTGLNNYMRDFGKLTADPEAMKHFGSTMVMWDFHARQPKKVFQVPVRRSKSVGPGAISTTTPSPPPRWDRNSGSFTRTIAAIGRQKKLRRSVRSKAEFSPSISA